MRQVLAALSLVVLSTTAHAAWGERDCSFGTNGVTSIGAPGDPFSISPEANGNLLIRKGSKTTTSSVVRISADGAFLGDVGGTAGPGVYDVMEAMLPSGDIVFATGSGVPASAIPAGVGKMNAVGALDTTFGNGGYATLPGFTRASAGPIVQPDGRILVGGLDNTGNPALARFNANGTPDMTFGSRGLATNPWQAVTNQYYSIALQPDGRILGLSFTGITRHLATGQIDSTFGSGGNVVVRDTTTSHVLSVRALASGDIVYAGTSNQHFTAGVVHVIVHNSAGALILGRFIITSQSGAVLSNVDGALPVYVMSDGRFVITGSTFQSPIIGRFTADLNEDTSQPLDFTPMIAYVQPTGRIVVGAQNSHEMHRNLGDNDFADCTPTTVSINDPAVLEGQNGITLLGFTVSLSKANAADVTVDYATANDTAVAGTDYTAVSGTLTFHPGQTQQWVVVPVIGNLVDQPNRRFFVNLSNASTGTFAKAQGAGAIVDDDPVSAAASVPMYRLYSDVTKEHLYTTDTNEYAVLPARGWVAEGTAYTMFGGGGSYGAQYAIPLYRIYHPGILQHHWTTDSNEVMVLVATGAWQYEGIPGYLLPSADPASTPLYRLMYRTPPLHLWTTDLNEKNVLSTQYGWVYEGVVGEVLP